MQNKSYRNKAYAKLSTKTCENYNIFMISFTCMAGQNSTKIIYMVNSERQNVLETYSLRSILIDSKIGVSRHILVLDTFIWESIKMEWREYHEKEIRTCCKDSLKSLTAMIDIEMN